ncbi:Large neutral amino acids transporter small subunit 1 [Aphelenchoides besseyi]|nr:Large neutral amino acids transporter small subunit 1 [Aphelenchoides besseyi]KAI6235299.1 Large neutral amino acids transporter small subunit 1 [Aphelenchoides besseyi]
MSGSLPANDEKVPLESVAPVSEADPIEKPIEASANEDQGVNVVNGQKEALLSRDEKKASDLDVEFTAKEKGDPDELAKLDEGRGLRKTLTLFNGITMSVGCIIGSGIFVSPTGVQKEAGSVGISLITWLASGLFVTMGAYSYAELATMIKKNGGDYTYIKEAFGPFLAFIRLFIEAVVVRPCTCTIVSLTFAIYMLKPFYIDCEPPAGSIQALAALLLLVLTAINCLSIRLSTLIQDTFTLAKVFALIAIIGTGIYLLIFGSDVYKQTFKDIWVNSNTSPGAISLSFYSALFAYQGWNYLVFIVDEMKNAQRDLPIAILVSCCVVTAIYVLTNVALYIVLSPDEMIGSPAVALDFANRVFGPLAFMMPIFVACSTLGSANGVIFTSSRLFYSGAQEGQMPELLGMTNPKTRTPIPAVILTGLLSISYLALSSNVIQLINYIQISYWLAIAGAIASLFYFRVTRPNEPRPIKVFILIPILFFIGCIGLVLIPIIGSPVDTCIGLGIMLSAVPIYVFFIVWQPKCLEPISKVTTEFLKNCLGLEKND